MENTFQKEHELWRKVIQKAKNNGEIKQDTDVKKTASLFRQVFLGMSYEQSFLNGLDVEELKDKFDSLYSLLKAWFLLVIFKRYFFLNNRSNFNMLFIFGA